MKIVATKMERDREERREMNGRKNRISSTPYVQLKTIKILLCSERWIVGNQLFLSLTLFVHNLVLARGFDKVFNVSEMPVGCLAWTRVTRLRNRNWREKDIQNDFSLILFLCASNFRGFVRSSCVCVRLLKRLLIHFSSTNIFIVYFRL